MTAERHRMAVASHLLLYDDRGQIVFLRRAHTGYFDGYWSLPAGHVEPGETLAQACVRETYEEIGVTLTSEDISAVVVQHKHDLDGEERIDIFFEARLLDARPAIREPDRCDGLTWANIHKPPQPLVPYIEAALQALTTVPPPAITYFGFTRPTTDVS